MKEVVIDGFNFKIEPGTREEMIISILEKARDNFDSRFKSLINFCRYVVYCDAEYRLYENDKDKQAMEVANSVGDFIHDEHSLSIIDKEIETSFTANG